jgi:WD40 repeat protein/class 3 adenylate cyclase
MALPQGTVTFLFTDLEGSTRLWEAHPREMSDALARHKAIVRGAVESHGGMVFENTGDGMLAVFTSARDAVRAVLAAQTELTAEDWSKVTGPLTARMGLHTDEGVLGGEHYQNQPLNRCARLMAVGHGGQALISGTTELLVHDDLPEDCGLLDLGEHRLRDLARPLRIFQLTAPGLRREFPPLRTPDAVASRTARCPYRGLLPFDESDAKVFYGRERLAAELAVKLASRATGGGMVVVTGASGSGKSSLLRAGLLPILARGQEVPGSDRLPRIVMTPTKDPLTELATRLAAVGGPDALTVREGLARHPDQAHLAIRSAVLAAAAQRDEEAPAPGDRDPRLVLIVDQFEQVFTLNSDPDGEDTRQAFITALRSAAENPAGPQQVPPALVVIAVRGDFWDRCTAVPELVSALQDGVFVVGPMTESELRVAVTGPAEAAGLHIDPGLTETILGDLRVAGEDRSAGVLPLLSQAMTLTWEHREGDRLTSRGYAQAGGISHAVQTGADRAYDALPAGQQSLARDVLRSMTVASRAGGYARRPVTRDDLYTGLPGAARTDIDAVLDAFAAERLAVLDEDRAQLSHDVLLRAWPRLRGWLEEDQADWIAYGQLAEAAATWHDSREDRSFLYRGTQLAELQQAVIRWSANPARSPALTDTQRGFLKESGRQQARSSRLRRGAVALLAVVALVAASTAWFAFAQRSSAEASSREAIFNQVTAEADEVSATDASLASQLDVLAYQMKPTAATYTRLISDEGMPLATVLAVPSGAVNSVAFSPDGRILAGATGSGLLLWDVSDPAAPRALGGPLASRSAVSSAVFSPDGRTLAAATRSGVLLWNVTDAAHPRALGSLDDGSAFDGVAFSPRGGILAGARGSGVMLWDVSSPAAPRALGSPLEGRSALASVAFSADGRTLAGATGPSVLLWDVSDPAQARLLRSQPGPPPSSDGHPADILSVAFSPDGRTLAAGAEDNAAHLWQVTNPAKPVSIGRVYDDTDSVTSVSFSADGDMLATGSADDTATLWDTAYPASAQLLYSSLKGHTGAVQSVAMSPDGNTLATGSADRTIRLWSIPRTVLTGHINYVDALALSRARGVLASGSPDGTVRLWNVANPAAPALLSAVIKAPASYNALGFSPNGDVLAAGVTGPTASSSGVVQLWQVTDPRHPALLGRPLAGFSEYVSTVAFSPDGRTLAAASIGGTIRLWNIADPASPVPLGKPLTGFPGGVHSVAFSPDGRTLAAGSPDGTIWLWNITSPADPVSLGELRAGNNEGVYSVAFSPDGRTLASGDGDGNIQLWNVRDPARAAADGPPLTGHTDVVYSVAFSPDGRTLASGSFDETFRLWNVANPADPQAIGGPVASSQNYINVVVFGPGGHTLMAADGDFTVRIWNLNAAAAVQYVCATTGNVLTAAQWHTYVPELPYGPPCGTRS